ncbi:MAG: DegQ family serine endoprotease [Calditrichaeota bacterium]|nr:DegQ family serine endoprotease [Calditrichota bacterium]MCB0269353.1 DegQ family serine endoprotease [Calditrichota bacterium]MCB9067005.1 DegQ family serine endoprotease [Calditrichia bacterium]
MSQHKSSLFSATLVFAGIIVGLILAAGFGIPNISNADSPNPPKTGENSGQPNQSTNSNLNMVYALSNAFADVAESVNPAVVTISTETTVRQRVPRMPSFFEDFFGPQGDREREFKSQGLGSGVIVQSNGVILTNNHVIRDADDIIVQLMDGREFPGKVTGTDPRSDIAVIQIDADNLPIVPIGNSDNLRVGEWVLAVGSPLSPEYNHTVTSGIISAKGRQVSGLTGVQDFLQTDAAINPGNSGGALVNLRGELVGINTAIASRTGQNSGIGFAISSNLAKDVMQDILEDGKVSRGWLGVQIGPVSKEVAEMYNMKNDDGVLIRSIEKNSPAEKDGVEPGDIILGVDDNTVKSPTELSSVIGSKNPGDKVTLKLLRDGKEKSVKVELGEFPDELVAGNSSNSNEIEDLGLTVQDLTNSLRSEYGLSDSDYGVIIQGIAQGGVAERAGLERGDLIMRINRSRITNTGEFAAAIKEIEPGDAVLLQIKRDGRRQIIDFVLPRE